MSPKGPDVLVTYGSIPNVVYAAPTIKTLQKWLFEYFHCDLTHNGGLTEAGYQVWLCGKEGLEEDGFCAIPDGCRAQQDDRFNDCAYYETESSWIGGITKERRFECFHCQLEGTAP